MAVRAWEKPWSLDELNDSVPDWSLASDAGLLNYLNEFSQKLINRTKTLENQINDLAFEVKMTDTSLHNTFNEFLMLSNVQFIENRVYEDDETHMGESEEEVKEESKEILTTEQVEAILLPKYSEALKYGVETIERAATFRELQERRSRPAPEPLSPRSLKKEKQLEKDFEKDDPYSKYPLPFLIGTKEFLDDETCGLYYDLTDDEEEVEDEKNEENGHQDGDASGSDEDGEDENDDEDDGNEAHSSPENSGDEEEDSPKPERAASVTVPKSPEESSEDPDADSFEDSPRGESSSNRAEPKAETTAVGEEGTFKDKAQLLANVLKGSGPPPKKPKDRQDEPQNLDSGSSSASFASLGVPPSSTEPLPNNAPPPVFGAPSTSDSLFSDDEEEDDDFKKLSKPSNPSPSLSQLPSVSQTKPNPPPTTQPPTSFDPFDDGEMFPEITTTSTSTSSKPSSSSPLTSSTNSGSTRQLQLPPVSQASNTLTSSSSSTPTSPFMSTVEKKESNSLFDDVDELEDVFLTPSTSSASSSNKPSPALSPANVSSSSLLSSNKRSSKLFDFEDEEEDDGFGPISSAPKPSTPSPTPLPDYNKAPTNPAPNTTTASPSANKPPTSTLKAAPSKSSLWTNDDEDEEDFWSTSSKPKEKPKTTETPKEKPKAKETPKSNTLQNSTKNNSSLPIFLDDEDNEPEPVVSRPSSTSKPSSTTKPADKPPQDPFSLEIFSDSGTTTTAPKTSVPEEAPKSKAKTKTKAKTKAKAKKSATSTPPVEETPVITAPDESVPKSSNLFDGETSPAPSTSTPAKKKAKTKAKKTAKQKTSVNDASATDIFKDEDLLPSPSPAPPTPTPTPSKQSPPLFNPLSSDKDEEPFLSSPFPPSAPQTSSVLPSPSPLASSKKESSSDSLFSDPFSDQPSKPQPTPTPTPSLSSSTGTGPTGNQTTAKPKDKSSKVAELQGKLALDPSKMLPGFKPAPQRSAEDLMPDLSQSQQSSGLPESKKLEHMTKSRPVVRGKRPPSRKPGSSATSSTSSTSSSSSTSASLFENPLSDFFSSSSSSTSTSTSSSSTTKRESSQSSFKVPAFSSQSSSDSFKISSSSFNDPLGSLTSSDTTSSSSTFNSSSSSLFSSQPTSNTNTRAPASSSSSSLNKPKNTSTTSSIWDNDEFDFSTPAPKPTPKATPKASNKSVWPDEEDSLFSDSFLSSKKDKGSSSKPKGDLFSSLDF